MKWWPFLLPGVACLIACQSGGGGVPADAGTTLTSAAEPPAAWRSFLLERLIDLADVASVRVAAGPGLLAQARATRWLAAGVGSLGPETTWVGGLSLTPHVAGWSLREGGVWTERRAEVGLSSLYYCEAEIEVIAGRRERGGLADRGDYDVGGELHFGLLGLAAEFRPDELLDFLVGWIGNDPMLDDAAR